MDLFLLCLAKNRTVCFFSFSIKKLNKGRNMAQSMVP